VGPDDTKTMVVSSGLGSGTYYRLMREFDEASPGVIVNTEADGSLTNIDRVMDNQRSLASPSSMRFRFAP
jgi:hypothetical protein